MNYHSATNAELSELGKYFYWAENWARWEAQVAGPGNNRAWKAEIGILLDRQERIREVLEHRKRQHPVPFSCVADAPQVIDIQVRP